MKKNLRLLAGAAVGAVVAIGFSSCAYDPYYSSASVGVSSGYGDGYGYGSPGFSTSVFVGTGNPQWGYDPTCYSYFDYRRHSYYDPYLNGYYPVGYRPVIVYGAPHPYGWHPGIGFIRPPAYVSNVTISNYRNRATLYQNTRYGWARQVRQQPATSGRVMGSHPTRSSNRYSSTRSNIGTHPSTYTHGSQTTTRSSSQYLRQSTKPGSHPQSPSQVPSKYNSSARTPRQAQQMQRATGSHSGDQRPNSGRQQAPQNGKKGGNPQAMTPEEKRARGLH